MAKKEILFTPKGRVSWPYVFEPRKAAKIGDKVKFEVTLIFDKAAQATLEWKALEAAVRKAAVEKFGEATVKSLMGAGKWGAAFKRGETKVAADGSRLKGYDDGTLYISAKCGPDYPPKVVDGNNQPITNKTRFYAGCYARASVNVFAYDESGNKGVSFGLWAVQKMGDGEKFGADAPVFAPVEGYTEQPASAGGDFSAMADEDIPF